MLVGYILSRVCLDRQFSELPSLTSLHNMGLCVFNWPIEIEVIGRICYQPILLSSWNQK